jgi:hypothetical protein
LRKLHALIGSVFSISRGSVDEKTVLLERGRKIDDSIYLAATGFKVERFAESGIRVQTSLNAERVIRITA